ncbi:MAG: helix-turn-helix transcriptional regulator [Clostridia bacterium]|nr:helix-turn-helix transcriptional regulator [Clostridia bacterium]
MRKPITRQFSINSFFTAYDYNWNSTYQSEGEAHDFWEIVYVASGAVGVTEDDRVYHVVEGNILLHAPMEFHNICSAEGTHPHVVILSFDATGELPKSLTEGPFPLSNEMRAQYESIFADVKAFVDDPEQNKTQGQEGADRLASFLLRLNRRYRSELSLMKTGSAIEYTRLVETMNKAIYENLSLEELAAARHISISYIKQLFKRYAGISPKAYYARLRCTEAIRQLQAGSSVTEVSDALHFSSPSYFSAFFKKMTGQPPARYVRQRQSEWETE